jgi:hypothetical protein
MAILNLKIHFIFYHFAILKISFLAKFRQLEKKGWNFFWHILHLCSTGRSKQFEAAAAAAEQPCFLLKHPFRIFGYLLEPCTEIWKVFFS